MNSLLFVCLGNICRSPLAEGIAKKIAKERNLDIKIDSAGIGPWHIGEPPCVNSINVARNYGIDISKHIARMVEMNDFSEYDLIVTFDHACLYDLSDMDKRENFVKLGVFGHNGADVPDPYFFKGYEGFEKVYLMIEECLINLFDEKFKSSN